MHKKQDPKRQIHYAQVRELIKNKQFNFTPNPDSSSDDSSDEQDYLPQKQSKQNEAIKIQVNPSRKNLNDEADSSDQADDINQRETLPPKAKVGKSRVNTGPDDIVFQQGNSPIKYDQCQKDGPQTETPAFQSQAMTRKNSVEPDIVQEFLKAQKDLDEQFVIYMLQIEERYQSCLDPNQKWLVEQWSKVLCQVIQNADANSTEEQGLQAVRLRENRNLYTILLLDQIISRGTIDTPFLIKPETYIQQLQILDKMKVK